MSTRGVVILNSGSKHCAHAAVCVATLRQHYQGPIALLTEKQGPGREACEYIAADIRNGPIEVIPHELLVAGSRGKSYQTKTLCPKMTPFDVSLFLDADTIVVGSIDELWPDEASGEVVLTAFADWVSTGNKMKQRIKPWAEVIKDDKGNVVYTPDAQQISRVAYQLRVPRPAINTGVWAWSKNSRAYCDEWHRVTNMRNTFIVDETACQIIYPEFNCRVMDDRWNASVVFPPAGMDVLTRQDVRIWHGHGGKFWKRDASGKARPGQSIFLPHYERCLRENIGCARAIRPHDKWFRQLSDEDQKRLAEYLLDAANPLVTVSQPATLPQVKPGF